MKITDLPIVCIRPAPWPATSGYVVWVVKSR